MAKQSKRSFRYKERSLDNIKERANARSGKFDSYIKPKYKMYKVRDGKNIIRILPPTWEDPNHYGFDIWVNYGIGVDNQSYLSLSKMKGEKDPLAEAQRQAMRDGDKKLSDDLQPTQRVLMWVIDRQAEEEGPQLWAAPQSVDRDLAQLCMDPDTKEVLYIDDPDKGRDFRFFKEGQMKRTKYPPLQMKLLAPSPIHEDEDQQEEWLEYVSENPAPEALQYYDYDRIATVFGGQAGVNRDDEDEDADEKPKAQKRPVDDDDEDEKPPKRRTRPAVDDDEDADEADDEDAEEKPQESIRERLKRRRSAATKSDDDEDE